MAPTYKDYHLSGTLRRKVWMQDGVFHRSIGPAVIEYYPGGGIFQEFWYIRGKNSRSDGPAYIEYYLEGKIRTERWIINGRCHRSDGPAYINYKECGSVDRVFYFTGGLNITSQVLEYIRENEIIDPMNIPFEHQLIMKMKFC